MIVTKKILRSLKWRFPFYSIPKLEEYREEVIKFSKEKNQLPFYTKCDINNDGKDEIIIIQKSIFDKIGRLVIVSENNRKNYFDVIRWEKPVNAHFFDYSIEITSPKSYQTFGVTGVGGKKPQKVNVEYPHVITKGHNSRIVFWNGEKYCQERI